MASHGHHSDHHGDQPVLTPPPRTRSLLPQPQPAASALALTSSLQPPARHGRARSSSDSSGTSAATTTSASSLLLGRPRPTNPNPPPPPEDVPLVPLSSSHPRLAPQHDSGIAPYALFSQPPIAGPHTDAELADEASAFRSKRASDAGVLAFQTAFSTSAGASVPAGLGAVGESGSRPSLAAHSRTRSGSRIWLLDEQTGHTDTDDTDTAGGRGGPQIQAGGRAVDIEDDGDDADEPLVTRSLLVKAAMLAGVFAILAFIVYKYNLLDLLKPLLVWVANHPTPGSIIQVTLLVFLTVTLLPFSTLMQVASGFLYRPVWIAILVNVLAKCLAATIATWIGTTWLKETVRKRVMGDRRLRRVVRVIEAEGTGMTVLLRMTVPFAIGSYVFSILDYEMSAYVAGTVLNAFINTLPPTFIGSLISDVLQISDPGTANTDPRVRYTLLLLSTTLDLSLVVTVALLTRRANRKLHERSRGATGHTPFTTLETRLLIGVYCVAAVVVAGGVSFIWLRLPPPSPT
ncbi:hypothetical protein BC831DRAFT_457551 [Entophlyctis helioformis]|nr:hypothetical protein BC831DRAFT_457551 [Entophlyctis helioformis]